MSIIVKNIIYQFDEAFDKNDIVRAKQLCESIFVGKPKTLELFREQAKALELELTNTIANPLPQRTPNTLTPSPATCSQNGFFREINVTPIQPAHPNQSELHPSEIVREDQPQKSKKWWHCFSC